MSTTDGSAKFEVRRADSVPVGAVVAFGGGSVPYGYLVCNGAAVSRTTYAKLFNAIGTAYGSGDGSTTFNLPNTEGRFVEGGTVGEYKSAGLPNIEGSLWARASNPVGVSGDGCFENRDWYTYFAKSSGGYDTYTQAHLNASRSSPIYGNSDTVQPNSVCAKYCIRYI